MFNELLRQVVWHTRRNRSLFKAHNGVTGSPGQGKTASVSARFPSRFKKSLPVD